MLEQNAPVLNAGRVEPETRVTPAVLREKAPQLSEAEQELRSKTLLQALAETKPQADRDKILKELLTLGKPGAEGILKLVHEVALNSDDFGIVNPGVAGFGAETKPVFLRAFSEGTHARLAGMALAKNITPEEIRTLLPDLQGPTFQKRLAVAEMLRACPVPEAAPLLLQAFEQSKANGLERNSMLQALIAVSPRDALAMAQSGLGTPPNSDHEEFTKLGIAKIVGASSDPKLHGLLVELSRSENSKVRLIASGGLAAGMEAGSLSHDAAQRALEIAGSANSPLDARISILDSIGRGRGFEPELAELMRSANPELAAAAGSALGRRGSLEAITALFQATKDQNADVRVAAAKGLAAADRTDSAVQSGVQILRHDNDPLVRAAVLGALDLGDRENRLSLLRLAIDGSPAEKSEASQALEAAKCGRDKDAFVARLTADMKTIEDRKLLFVAAGILSSERVPEAIAFLEGALTGPSKTEARDACAILCESGQPLESLKPAVISHLRAQLEEKGAASERAYALSTLARVDPQGSLDVLKKYLSSREPEMATSAAQALATVSGSEGGRVLLEAAKNPSPSVRKAAAYGLGLRSDSGGGPAALSRLEKDPNPAVALAATAAKYTTSESQSVDRADVERVTRLLCHNDRETAASAYRVLGDLYRKDRGAVTAQLVRSLDSSKDTGLRQSSARALGAFAGLESAPILTRCLLKENGSDRFTIGAFENALRDMAQANLPGKSFNAFMVEQLGKASAESPLRAAEYQDLYRRAEPFGIELPLRFDPAVTRRLLENRAQGSGDSAKLAVVNYPKTDWNNYFHGGSDRIKTLIEHGYRVMYYEEGKDSQVAENLKAATKNHPAPLIILGAHGMRGEMQYGESDPRSEQRSEEKNVDVGDLGKFRAAGLGSVLAPGGVVVLESCSTGSGRDKGDNMANMFLKLWPGASGIYAPTIPSALVGYLFKADGSVAGASYFDGIENTYVARQRVTTQASRPRTASAREAPSGSVPHN